MNLSSPPAHADVSDDVVRKLYEQGRITDPLNLFSNESVILKAPTCSALALKKSDGNIYVVKQPRAFALEGRNAEQRLALHILLDKDIPIVSLGGLAGTGKSILALAAGIEQTLEQKNFSRVAIFRPLYPVGEQELGYLPGDFDEKMNPWSDAVWDALDAFCDQTVQDYISDQGMLEVLPLTHLRGRTLSDAFIIIDEAQNLDLISLVTALTRVGEGSKIVLTHDINQRDNKSVGRNDGVMTVVERLLGEPLFAAVNLHKVERSAVAKLVSEKFQDI